MKKPMVIAVVGVLVLIGFAYLIGLLPERQRRLALEREVASLQSRLADAEATGRVCGLYTRVQGLIDVVAQQNYGQAVQVSTAFFDEIRAEADRTNEPAIREVLRSVLATRDSVTGALTKADPASLEVLRRAADLLRGVLENVRPCRPRLPGWEPTDRGRPLGGRRPHARVRRPRYPRRDLSYRPELVEEESAMSSDPSEKPLSPWWRHAVILVMVLGFGLLTVVTVLTYSNAPPIPERVTDAAGATLFTRENVEHGQEVFLKYGLMEHGSLWGHGAYLGPDYSAEYLHRLAEIARDTLARERRGLPYAQLDPDTAASLDAGVHRLLKENRYDPATGTLRFSPAEAAAWEIQRSEWAEYFSGDKPAPGLPAKYIRDPNDLADLNSYFAWAAWATVANRPGKDYSYTNNWPYEPAVGNRPSASTYLWSALSLVTLLAGLGAVLFAFGRFDFLGWHGSSEAGHAHDSAFSRWALTPSQRVVGLYFGVVLLFLLQTMAGGALAHYRVESGAFYGIDLARYLPYNLLRTFHLQLAIFWIATAWVAGGLFLAPIVEAPSRAGSGRALSRCSWPSPSSSSGVSAASGWASTTGSGSSGSGLVTRGRSTWISGASGSSCWRSASWVGSSSCTGRSGRRSVTAIARSWPRSSSTPRPRSPSSTCPPSSSGPGPTSR